MNPGNHDGEHRLGSACFRVCVYLAANPERSLDTVEVLAVIGECNKPYLQMPGNLTHALRKACTSGWLDKRRSRGPGNRAVYRAGPELRRIAFTILGEPASKANSRIHRPTPNATGGIMVIKSKKALSFEHDALRQIPPAARQRLEGPVRVTLRIFYASERPDLDESIVLDVLQDRFAKRDVGSGTEDHRVLVQAGVYRNDRQVREKHVFHAIDRKNPRVEIMVEPMQAQQPELGLAPKPTDPFADWPTDERTAA
jgi:hypothetical protein